MNDRTVNEMTNEELIEQLAECISLEGEIKMRSEPLRKEILKRQVETGETNIENNGWVSTLKKEPITAAWISRQYGYPKEEIPTECYNEEVKLVLDGEKVVHWLDEAGHDIAPSYTISFGRKRSK